MGDSAAVKLGQHDASLQMEVPPLPDAPPYLALPFLLWSTDLPLVLRVAILLGIEYAFNVGDAAGAGTALSSAILQQAHWLLLAAVFVAGVSGRALQGRRLE